MTSGALTATGNDLHRPGAMDNFTMNVHPRVEVRRAYQAKLGKLMFYH